MKRNVVGASGHAGRFEQIQRRKSEADGEASFVAATSFRNDLDSLANDSNQVKQLRHLQNMADRSATVRQLKVGATSGRDQVAQLLTPQGNLATYDAAQVVPVLNANNNPTNAVVRNSGVLGPASNPQDPGGWAALTQNVANMDDPGGLIPAAQKSTFEIDACIDYDNDHAYTRMHAVNSWLALNSNNANNIFSGKQAFNKEHEQAVESYAKGFMERQSWRITTGQTLVNSLNNQDQIGRNAAGQLYYKAGGTNSFPVTFYNAGAMVVGNDGANYPSVDSTRLANYGLVLEYEVIPSYNLNPANVKNNINAFGMGKYNARPSPAHMGETFPLNAGAIHNAVTALCLTYATNLQINTTLHAPNPTAIANGVDIPTDNLTWRPFQSPPVLMQAEQPAAEMKLSYRRAAGNRTGSWYSSFEI